MSEPENKAAEAPAQAPTQAPAQAPAPAPAEDTGKAEAEALKKQVETQAKELETYKAKEQAELDKQKSAEQKLAEKDAEIERIKRENLIVKIGAKKGLDPDLFDRVKGGTEEEIGADVDLLLTKFAKPEDPAGEAKGKKTQTGAPATSPAADPKVTNILEERNAEFMAWRGNRLASN